jgi:hypothetical protein
MANVQDRPIRQSLSWFGSSRGLLHCLIMLYVTVWLDIEKYFLVFRQFLHKWHKFYAAQLHEMFKYYGIFTQSKNCGVNNCRPLLGNDP